MNLTQLAKRTLYYVIFSIYHQSDRFKLSNQQRAPQLYATSVLQICLPNCASSTPLSRQRCNAIILALRLEINICFNHAHTELIIFVCVCIYRKLAPK